MRRLSVTGAILALLGVVAALASSVLPAGAQTDTGGEDPGFRYLLMPRRLLS